MTSITIKEYFAVPGSLYSNKDAQKIGPVLTALSEQGAVTARDVVDAARSANSPLHDYFEWNDKVAADLWRIEGARRMLRSIQIKYLEGVETRTARAFQVQRQQAYETEPRKYHTFQVLHGDSAFAAQMMDSAFEDLMTWRRKYEPYVSMWKNFGNTFQAVINQIDEWQEEFRILNVAVETDEALVKLLQWREECSDVLATWTGCREQIEFLLDAVRDAETTFAKLNESKHRDCLKCGKSFVSVSVGNRICKTCLNSKTINERNVNVIDAKIAG